MTAICGIWDRTGGGGDLSNPLTLMLNALSSYGNAPTHSCRLKHIALGTVPYTRIAVERPAVPLKTNSLLAVIDARLDNRDDIAAFLHLDSRSVSDAELVFWLYAKRKAEAFNMVAGDYAAAFLDKNSELLTLVRDPTGQKPLHYSIVDGLVAFSSMPHGLRILFGSALDERALAMLVSDIPRTDETTYFRSVQRIKPGHIVTIGPDGITNRAFWSAPRKTIRFRNDSDYVDAYRDVLEKAVRSRIGDAGTLVGAHLSGGLDSNGVAATAALLKRGTGSVLAVTAAPREGFVGPVPRGRIGDESEMAAKTAALHPNMEHLILRTAAKSPLEEMSIHPPLCGEPIGHACNYVWWSSANSALAERGISVVLTGESGNLTLSAGGPPILADFIRTASLLGWLREARALRRKGFSRRGVTALSLGPWVPRWLWDLVARRQFGHTGRSEGVDLLAPPLRAFVEAGLTGSIRNARYGGNDRVYRHDFLQSMDPGVFRKGALARWGIDERDVTVDRRLAEFSLALPLDQLIRDGVSRRLARTALSDRLPVEVLHGARGYQFADWYETLSRDRLLREVDILAAIPEVHDLLDMERVSALAARWPEDGWETTGTIVNFRLTLLRVLGAAHFVAAMARGEGAGLAATGVRD